MVARREETTGGPSHSNGSVGGEFGQVEDCSPIGGGSGRARTPPVRLGGPHGGRSRGGGEHQYGVGGVPQSDPIPGVAQEVETVVFRNSRSGVALEYFQVSLWEDRQRLAREGETTDPKIFRCECCD